MTTARTPVQKRSQATHDALLDAAEELGRSKTYDQLTVQEIAAHAGYTIGAFYARFPSKSALLEALLARYEAMLDVARNDVTASTTDVVQHLAETFIAAFERSGGLLRLLESAFHAEPGFAERVAALRAPILDFAIDALRSAYPIAKRDLETAALLLIVPLRELYYKREFWPTTPSRRKSQTTQLVEAVRTYLETRVAASAADRRRKS